jgi:hypothetical protein
MGESPLRIENNHSVGTATPISLPGDSSAQQIEGILKGYASKDIMVRSSEVKTEERHTIQPELRAPRQTLVINGMDLLFLLSKMQKQLLDDDFSDNQENFQINQEQLKELSIKIAERLEEAAKKAKNAKDWTSLKTMSSILGAGLQAITGAAIGGPIGIAIATIGLGILALEATGGDKWCADQALAAAENLGLAEAGSSADEKEQEKALNAMHLFSGFLKIGTSAYGAFAAYGAGLQLAEYVTNSMSVMQGSVAVFSGASHMGEHVNSNAAQKARADSTEIRYQMDSLRELRKESFSDMNELLEAMNNILRTMVDASNHSQETSRLILQNAQV